MQKNDKYIYPAVFTFYDNENGKSIGITFPDLPGCVSCADSIEEALFMASDALGMHLAGMEDDNDPLPTPSDIPVLLYRTEANQTVVPVAVFMPEYREALDVKPVNKMVTMPRWLEAEGKKRGVNFSQLMQEALKDRLVIARPVRRRRVR